MAEINWNWSKSRIKSYRNCPFAFKLSNIDKIESGFIEALDKGTQLHTVFEKFYLFDCDMNKTLEETKFPASYKFKYKHHIDNFLKFNERWKLKPYITEGKQVVGNIVGVVDRIDEITEGKEYIVIDYKTSEGHDIDDYMDELLLYAFIAQEKYKIPITEVGIYFSGNDKFIKVPVTKEQIMKNHEDMQEEITLYTEAIELDCFEPMKGVHCNWCGFKDKCKLFGGTY